MRTLHVKCPFCGEGQPFEFERTRDDGTFSGFQRGPDEKVLLSDGRYDAAAIMRETYYECYHCRGKWLDNEETRARLDASSYYVATNPKASPDNAGYSWPCWINRRIPWGGDLVMLGYLNAKRIFKDFANIEPLKQWYQKRAAVAWSDRLAINPVSVITSATEGVGMVDEACRVMFADAQQGDIPQKTGKFWVVARAIDKDAKNIIQLYRGYCESWKELFEIQKKLKIPNDNCGIDGGYYLQEIVDAIAHHFEVVTRVDPRTKNTYKARAVWKVLMGDARRNSYPHGDGIFRAFSKPSYHQRNIEVEKGKFSILNISSYVWSNFSVKDQLYNLIAGGEGRPKFTALDRSQLTPQTQVKEVGDLAYGQQIKNQYRTNVKGKNVYVETSPNVHYADCECGCLVLFNLGGFLGLPAAPEENAQLV